MFLGVANGAFSIAAIATMMRLAGEGGAGREGTRMGLWGAAQAAAFGLGGLLGTAASDLAHALLGEQRTLAYGGCVWHASAHVCGLGGGGFAPAHRASSAASAFAF